MFINMFNSTGVERNLLLSIFIKQMIKHRKYKRLMTFVMLKYELREKNRTYEVSSVK